MNTSTAAVHSIIDAARVANARFVADHHREVAATGAPLASIHAKAPNGRLEIHVKDDHVRAVAGIVEQAKRKVLAVLEAQRPRSFMVQGMNHPLAEFESDPLGIFRMAQEKVGKINYRATVIVVSYPTPSGKYRAALRVRVTSMRDGDRKAWNVQPANGDWREIDVKPFP